MQKCIFLVANTHRLILAVQRLRHHQSGVFLLAILIVVLGRFNESWSLDFGLVYPRIVFQYFETVRCSHCSVLTRYHNTSFLMALGPIHVRVLLIKIRQV